MSTSQIYYLDMKGTSQVDYLDIKSTSQLESLEEVKDIFLGLSSFSVVLLCEPITRVPIVSSVLYKAIIHHHFGGWHDPGQHAVLPVAGLNRALHVGCWLTFRKHICVLIYILLQATIIVGACSVLCLAVKSFVSLWWCIVEYKRSGILQYRGQADRGYKKTEPDPDISNLLFVSFKRNRIF